MYVTYDFYSNTYGGTLVPNTDFDRYNLKAQNALDNYTLKPSKTLNLLDTHFGDKVDGLTKKRLKQLSTDKNKAGYPVIKGKPKKKSKGSK